MTKPMSKMLLYVGIFFAIVFGWYGIKQLIFMWFMTHYQPPAITVSSAPAKEQVWQGYLNGVGTLTAINGVDLSAEVPGIVEQIRFNSGQYVHKGDVIIVLRNQREQANLKSNQAKLVLAKMNYEREETLFKRKVTSQALLDTRYAELLEAQAGVEAVSAQIQEKTITAPFDGRLGVRMVDLGEYVSPGTPLVTLQSLDPLYVRFSLPEQYLSQLYIGQDVDISVNLEGSAIVKGKITAINSKVSQDTRNILVQATIPNTRLTLYPGMYGQVKIWLRARNNTIVIPQTAISYSLSGDYIFILKDEGKSKDKPEYHAYRQYVKVGERREDSAAISDGLKPGDLVVTSGQLKLQNGTAVLIDNNVTM